MTEGPAVRELDITLERNSPVPLYYQLAQSIEHAINTGALAPGDRLENELVADQPARTVPADGPTGDPGTREEGSAGPQARRRHPGGAFAVPPRRAAEQPQRGPGQGRPDAEHPGARVSVGELDSDIRDAIEAAAVTDVEFLKIRRLRLADDVPLAILTNYLPARFGSAEADLERKGLYACLRALGVNLKIAHQQISARLMTDEEAELLDEETPAACLTVDRIAYDDVGQFVEFGRHIYHAAHYSIQSSLMV